MNFVRAHLAHWSVDCEQESYDATRPLRYAFEIAGGRQAAVSKN